MLILRIISGIVLAAIVLAILFQGGKLPFYFLVMVFAGLCLWEFNSMMSKGGYKPSFLISILGGLAIISSIYFKAYFGLVIATLVILVFLRYFIKKDTTRAAANVGLTILSPFYIGFLLSHYVMMRNFPHGAYLIFFVFGAMAVNDTTAYAIGMKWGKKKLAAHLSPGKTWEGTIAGIILTMIIMTAISFIPIFKWFPKYFIVLFLLIIAIAGILGDLAESLLKRSVGVKDAGFIIPGHGGVLERADCFLFAAPVAYYFFKLLFIFDLIK